MDDLRVEQATEAIYSPSQTEDWLRCPRERAYKRQWVPRTVEFSPALVAGRALHAGMEAAYRGVLGSLAPPSHEIGTTAALVTLRELYQAHSVWTLDRLEKVVGAGVGRALGFDLGGIPLHVEHQVEQGRLDLLVKRPDGDLVVIDYKTVLQADESGLALRGRDLETGQQRWYYPWAVERQFGKRPLYITFLQVLLMPLTLRPLSFDVTTAGLRAWEHNARLVWMQMRIDENSGVTWQNTRSCYRYGRKCEFWDACHVLYGDTSQFDALYVKRAEVTKDAL